jgi:hypothetical protein
MEAKAMISLHGGFEKNILLFQWSKRTVSLWSTSSFLAPPGSKAFCRLLRTEPTSQQAWEIDAFTPRPLFLQKQ